MYPIRVTPRELVRLQQATSILTLQVGQVETPRGRDNFSSRASSRSQEQMLKEGLSPQHFLAQILTAQHCKV